MAMPRWPIYRAIITDNAKLKRRWLRSHKNLHLLLFPITSGSMIHAFDNPVIKYLLPVGKCLYQNKICVKIFSNGYFFKRYAVLWIFFEKNGQDLVRN
jgi:hypothetical protein